MNEKSKNSHNGLIFIKDVAKYFMDFLETDFHKRRNPKRSIKLRNNDNLLIGLNLNKYPKFINLVWKTVLHAFDNNIINTIGKGVYRTNIPKNLLDLVKLQSEKISSKQIAEIVSAISEKVENSATLHKKEYDKALTTVLENTSEIIKHELVLPFIGHLEKPIESLNLGDEYIIFLMEEELTSLLVKLFENKISELLNLLIVEKKTNTTKELKSVFEPGDVKVRVVSFFDRFQVGDLFAEVFEMERNRNILDKQEFYLYFCDITFDKVKYPIFYIPFSVKRQVDTLIIEFDFQVYINKKALEYVVQEYNPEKGTKGSLQTISERIIYLTQHKTDFKDIINSVLCEIVNFFELDAPIDFTSSAQQLSKSLLVRVSNTCFISLFDKSDEALVNDYEEILQLLASEDSSLAEIFNKLIDDFIHKNPISFNSEVEDEWDSTDTCEKLVFTSPIPLNSEQRQILSAIRKDGCKYITVEGPPGTGKSHTITAIIFDYILKDQSVLVLSDKKEALDVVEDKITGTLKYVRSDERFQNPILRLGKIGSNYSQILSNTALGDIKNHYRAVKKNYATIKENIEKSINTLNDDLEAEILSYREIDIKEIYELSDLERYYEENGFPVETDEVSKQHEPDVEFEEIRNIFFTLKNKLSGTQDHANRRLLDVLNLSTDSIGTVKHFKEILQSLVSIYEDLNTLKEEFGENINLLSSFDDFSKNNLEKLKQLISQYEEQRNWLLGYLFKNKKLEELDRVFKKSLPRSRFDRPHKHIDELKRISEIYDYALNIRRDGQHKTIHDYSKTIHHLLKDEELLISLQDIVALQDDLVYLTETLKKYPLTLNKLHISPSSLYTLCDNELTKMTDLDFNRLIRYFHLKQKMTKNFANIPPLNYAHSMKNVEDLVTAQMTYLLDGRLIDFYENNKATAKALRDIIRNKQRFPRDEFIRMKEAFPCILSDIRDYAEYIPLEPEIFDLVIIDEASQVSIAQAFPALLRAKKVLILGDKKQFSNIKAAQARSDTNREYLNYLGDSFRRNVSGEPTKLVKLNKFNIKTSILEFFEFISNYHTQLLKHFRGYKEIISYSNKYFYQDNLQVMKIRGKPINDVVKFAFIKHDCKKELIPNTNSLEIEYIIDELKNLRSKDSNISVGIITPHTNQQKLLIEKINQINERDYFFEKLKLKIMTFDTCQGEERDIIFYSMVATKDEDRLWGIFIKDLNSVDIEEDGKIKAQRLNVGFSRAKEQIHLILSKPLEEYTGSIRDALRHYHFTFEEAKKEHNISEVDERSEMEPEVMNWFYQTDFWKKNKDNIAFIPQFEIGKYLRQLDNNYSHPAYKVDFLLVYKDEHHKEHKIIIEYDGFKEHFQDIDYISEFNYEHYYSEDDVYREKVLESYGYRFLRINKFNIGDNPISTLNKRISSLVKGGTSSNNILSNIHQTIEDLQTGEMKECPKCKEVRSLKEFRDNSLITGYGRFCNQCKGRRTLRYKRKEQKKPEVIKDTLCPKCGSSMVLRRGRYGRFYGCSRFPYCKGTRQNS
jgi:superfamily I DNA and/or RNA helicase/very-short-patch-repair endonuclease